MKKALIAFCCAFVLLLVMDYGSHYFSLGGFAYSNSQDRTSDVWWTFKRDAAILIGGAALCAAIIYAKDRKKNKDQTQPLLKPNCKIETTFLIGVVSAALIIWPFIFYKLFHSQHIISTTSSAAFLSMLTGSVLAFCGLITPGESHPKLFYFGKMICVVIVTLELVGALLMMKSCVQELRSIQ
jgi:hypothetical protein